MTWPGWGEVLPLVVGAVTLFAVLVGGMRALTRTVAEQASAAAREAAKEATDALYERLRTNDFKHVEDGVAAGLAEVNKRLDGIDGRIDRVESRIGERFDRARQDRKDMEARILAAVRRRQDKDPDCD